jgi:glycosyltransferase involved in cell wall biosynthesis
MKKPLISVVMPVYNAERYLNDSIQSILNQTFKDFEFIIINDGSTDHSKKILEKFKKEDKRIVLINNTKNLGLQKTLNRGLKIAKGRYIARMDADDISLPNRLGIQFSYLEKNKDIFLIGGSAIVIDEEGEKIGSLLKGNNPKKIQKKLLKYNPFVHPSIMFRNTKEFFYREKFICSEDYDLYLRMISNKKLIVNIPDFLIRYRITKNSFVSTMPHQLFYLNKAKEFYWQRKKYGKDNYENIKPPLENKKQMPFDKLSSRTKILVKFQDNQMRETRKEIKNYFNNYGFDKSFAIYYVLSFLPYRLINILREIF